MRQRITRLRRCKRHGRRERLDPLASSDLCRPTALVNVNAIRKQKSSAIPQQQPLKSRMVAIPRELQEFDSQISAAPRSATIQQGVLESLD